MSLRWYQQARYMFLLLLTVFVVPMVVAWFMVSHRIYWGTVNHGHLIQPPIDLAKLTIRTKTGERWRDWQSTWWLVYKSHAQCEQHCMDQLYQIRQINIALGKNRLQLQRALLLPSSTDLDSKQSQRLTKAYAGTHLWTVHQASWQRVVLAKLPKKLAFRPGALYLVDPGGNVLLAYPANAPGKAVLHDLNRLLKVSKYHAKKL